MSINLNKGDGAGSAPERKNSDTTNSSGLDVNKINFSKSPVHDKAASSSESEKSGVDSKKINFEKPPITKDTSLSDKATSKMDSSKINYQKKPLSPAQTTDKSSKTKDVKENPSHENSVNAEKKSTNRVWIGLVALVITGIGLFYFIGSSKQGDGLKDTPNSASEPLAGSVNPQTESGVSPVDTTGTTGNVNMPTATNEASPGQNTASTSSTELEPQQQQVASSRTAGSNQGSNQMNAASANNFAQSNPALSNQTNPIKSNSAPAPSSDKNKNLSVNTNPPKQSKESIKGNNKPSASAAPNAMENTPVAQFGFGSTDATQLNDDLIQQIINKMNADKSVNIQVNGYASSDGPLDLNVRLSQERADNFRDMLIAKGVQQERITAIGRGIENPIGDNNTPEGRKMNRRIELDFQ